MVLNSKQQQKALQFHRLHHGEKILFLPNVWDVISAKLFEKKGAKAIGTTSAGIAATLGFPDGQNIPKELFLSTVQRIVSAVNVPVTVDIEAGYGATNNEISELVQQVIDLGAVGINIEDTNFTCPNTLMDITRQVEIITAIKDQARKNNLALFINARTDVYWLSDPSVHDKYQETVARFIAYANAGANCIFIHGINDSTIIQKLCNTVDIPVNILAGSWITSYDMLKTMGVSRVSIGSGGFRTMLDSVEKMGSELLNENNFKFLEHSFSYHELQQILSE